MRLLFATVLAFVAASVVGFAAVRSEPLGKLERAARAFDYRQAGYHTDGRNDLYWKVQELEATGQLYLGVTITYGTPHYGAAGTSTFSTRQIVIDEVLSWNDRLAVLAHELGHMLQPRTLGVSEGEVFAEGVSYLVSRGLGHDAVNVHARYLAAHKPNLNVLSDYAVEIQWAASVLSR